MINASVPNTIAALLLNDFSSPLSSVSLRVDRDMAGTVALRKNGSISKPGYELFEVLNCRFADLAGLMKAMASIIYRAILFNILSDFGRKSKHNLHKCSTHNQHICEQSVSTVV